MFVLPQANPYLVGLFWFALKLGVTVCLVISCRGTFPRFRYDQLMDAGWRWLIPISMRGLIVNRIVRLLVRG